LNAVGLSNFGAAFYLKKGIWQEQEETILVSYMAVGPTPEERLKETIDFTNTFAKYHDFRSRFGLEINFSCPNVGLHHADLVDEVSQILEITSHLGVPQVAKFNIFLPVQTARIISRHKLVMLSCINTDTVGEHTGQDRLKDLFGCSSYLLKRNHLWRPLVVEGFRGTSLALGD